MKHELEQFYQAYIACLNKQDWQHLGTFVSDGAIHNGKQFGLDGYRAMLENDFAQIPDLHFNIALLICDPPYISARLHFNCTPKGVFFGLPINGRRVSFAENVIYEVAQGKIVEVWSVIDTAAIAAQLAKA